MKNNILITILIICCNVAISQSVTRGGLESEIYTSIRWYWNFNTNEFVHVIWRSTDNGRHLSNQYASTTMPQQGTGLYIVGDATPGVLYGVNYNKLYFSSNSGITWEFFENMGQDGRVTSGLTQGEIYKYNNIESQGPALWRSSDYAQNFTLMNESVHGRPEVGNSPGELYLRTGTPFDGLYILKSNNYGLAFDTIIINDEIAGTSPGGYYPEISHGAVPGELYLITWHLPGDDYVFRVYYSNDYGQNFQLKYQSGEANFLYWGYCFAAGREPGSFYVVRYTPDSYEGNASHVHLYIDYSSDYGQNYTTFFHDTDNGYDGNPTSIIHTISLISSPDGGGTVQGSGRYEEGTEITIVATPEEGYEFINWTENGEFISENPEYSFSIDCSKTLTANFRLKEGTNEPENLLGIMVYPNPFSGIVNFSFPLIQGNKVLKIYDFMGNIVFNKNISIEKNTFDLSHFSKGVYFFSFDINSKTIYKGTMIKL